MSEQKSINIPYRQEEFMVLTEAAEMPRRCPLCNSSEVVDVLEVRFANQRKSGVIAKAVGKMYDAMKGWNYTGPICVKIYFCAKHRARKKMPLQAGSALLVIGVVCALFSLDAIRNQRPDPLAFVGFVSGFLGLYLIFATLTGVLNLWFRPKVFQDRTVWVKGACKEFLDSLPTK